MGQAKGEKEWPPKEEQEEKKGVDGLIMIAFPALSLFFLREKSLRAKKGKK